MNHTKRRPDVSDLLRPHAPWRGRRVSALERRRPPPSAPSSSTGCASCRILAIAPPPRRSFATLELPDATIVSLKGVAETDEGQCLEKIPLNSKTLSRVFKIWPFQGRGIGSQLHHLSYCFLASYGTQRTLILDTKNYNGNPEGLETFFLPLSDTCTSYDKSQMVPWPGKKDSLVVRFPSMDRPNPRPNYFPKSIPKDISERLVRLHGDPFAWWMGQFFKYAMRTNKDFQDYIDNQAREMGYESPIVGLQIRRSDKLIHEAVYIDLSVYMEEVEGFYKQLELRQPVAQRRVFLATDDPNVIAEIKQKYPEYKVVYNSASVDSTRLNQRKKSESVRYFFADVYFLSRSDFLVCGMTSNICRLSYELMQSLHADASTRVSSVDRDYYFHYEVGNVVKARFPHKPRRPGELEMQEGDEVNRNDLPTHFRKHPSKDNGFLWGRNTRTKKFGYYPVYKTVEVLKRANIQSFEDIDRIIKPYNYCYFLLDVCLRLENYVLKVNDIRDTDHVMI
nr:alpha-(1,6)-fucosyltransferase-like [Penaeus vannamei]